MAYENIDQYVRSVLMEAGHAIDPNDMELKNKIANSIYMIDSAGSVPEPTKDPGKDIPKMIGALQNALEHDVSCNCHLRAVARVICTLFDY